MGGYVTAVVFIKWLLWLCLVVILIILRIFFDRVSRREHGDPQIEELNIGEAAEPEGRGTGDQIILLLNYICYMLACDYCSRQQICLKLYFINIYTSVVFHALISLAILSITDSADFVIIVSYCIW